MALVGAGRVSPATVVLSLAAYISLLALLLSATPSLAQSKCSGDACAVNREMLTYLNAFRAENGKTPLCISEKLIASAQGHSQYMAKTRRLSHIGANRSTFKQRILAAGFPNGRLGENLFKGWNANPRVVVNWWKRDKGHKGIMLGRYSHFGVYKFGIYWTLDVGSSKSEKCVT